MIDTCPSHLGADHASSSSELTYDIADISSAIIFSSQIIECRRLVREGRYFHRERCQELLRANNSYGFQTQQLLELR